MVYAAIALLLGLVALDQAVKYWTVLTFAAPMAGFTSTADPALPGIPGLVELTRIHNYGAAWSSFSGMRWALVGVTSVLMVILAVLLAKKIVRHPTGFWGLLLILAGGIGNLIDRVRLGYVVDMFNFQFMDFPVFNVADICVCCGAALGVIYYLWFMKCDEKKETSDGNDSAASAQ